MRKSFNGLSAIVTGKMGGNLRSGDAFVFLNATCKHLRVLRYDDGVLVMYAARLALGRMHAPWSAGNAGETMSITHSELLRMVSLVGESTYVKRMRQLPRGSRTGPEKSSFSL